MPTRMPLRHPRIRQRLTKFRPKVAEELRDVCPERIRIKARLRVGQRRQAIKHVRGAVAAQLPPRTATRLRATPRRIGTIPAGLVPPPPHKATTRLTRLRVKRQR